MPLHTCCGCLSLRAGSIALGAFLVTITSLTGTASLAVLIYLLVEGSDAPPLPLQVPAVLLAVSALHLVFAALLTHGARHGRRLLLLAWLIFCAIAVILQGMAVVVAVALAGMAGAGTVNCAVMAAAAVWTGLLCYGFAVVLFHSFELIRREVMKINSGAAAGGGKPVQRTVQV